MGFKTAVAFSESIDVSRTTYQRYELGTGMPKADDLATMVAAGVDVHYLLTGARLTGSGAPDGLVRIKVMEDEPSAGHGAVTDGHAMVRGFLDVQQDWAGEFLGSRVNDTPGPMTCSGSVLPSACSRSMMMRRSAVPNIRRSIAARRRS